MVQSQFLSSKEVDNLTDVFSQVMQSSFEESRSTTKFDSFYHSTLAVQFGGMVVFMVEEEEVMMAVIVVILTRCSVIIMEKWVTTRIVVPILHNNNNIHNHRLILALLMQCLTLILSTNRGKGIRWL